VSFRGLWEDAQNYFVVMELVIGEEVFDRLMDIGHFPEAEVSLFVKSLGQCCIYLFTTYEYYVLVCLRLRLARLND